MNALGNLHLDAAIPVTVAAMNLKVIRVSHKTPFMLRRGYEDLSGALRGSSVLSCLLSRALLCAPVSLGSPGARLGSPELSCALLGFSVLTWALLGFPWLSLAVLGFTVRLRKTGGGKNPVLSWVA